MSPVLAVRAGSTRSVLRLAKGSITTDDIVAVDVSDSIGLEARAVAKVSARSIRLDRPLSAVPKPGRSVYVGTTFRVQRKRDALQCWQFLDFLAGQR